MLETTWLFALVLAHVATVFAVVMGFRSDNGPVIVIAALLGVVLFSIAALGATSVQVVADDGSTVTQPQPAMGWYAFGMALVSVAVTIVAALAWFRDGTETNTYGNTSW